MDTEENITNKVANSGLITFDLEKYYLSGDRIEFDIKDQLYEGLILREKEFRTFIKMNDWSKYQNKFVAVHCSVEAIIPVWAYLLLALALGPYAAKIIFGTLEELETEIFKSALLNIDWSEFKDKKVVVKGCSKVEVPTAIYVEAVNQLRPYVNSLMFGEPCSTVPLLKKGAGFTSI